MSVIAAAVIGSAVVGAGASYVSSKENAKGQAKGVEAEKEMADASLVLQRELVDQQREDFAPWRDIGKKALDQVWAGVQSGEFDPGKLTLDKFDPSQVNVTQDPGYKFRMEQGQEALDKSAASRGRLLSGAQQKALTEYGQGMGSQEYGNAYARYSDKYNKDITRQASEYASEADRKARQFNMLSGLSQGGQSSAAGQAQATQNLASTSGNIMSNLGRSQNVAQQNTGAARGGAYTDAAQGVNQAAQNWLTYKALA